MARSKATLGDVASMAGVSLATVDRVINKRGAVRSETEAAVMQAALRLNLDRSLSRTPTRLLRFNIVMHSSQAGFFQKLRRSFRLAQAAFKSLNIVLNTFPFELEKDEGPTKAIEAAARNCHGLVYVGPDHPKAMIALQAVPPGCPIVTFATDVPTFRRAAYFGLDNYATGRLAGDLMGRFTAGATGAVLSLIGLYSFVGHRQRDTGYRSVLAERYPNLMLLPTCETHEDPARAVAYVRDQIRQHGKIVGIYNSSNGNRVISDYLVEAGKSAIVFINHELTEKTRSHLMNGVVDVIIDHNTDSECLNAVEYLLYCNHRIGAQEMVERSNLNLYFRETAVQARPVV
jgi:LacI family transcriptional regulator